MLGLAWHSLMFYYVTSSDGSGARDALDPPDKGKAGQLGRPRMPLGLPWLPGLLGQPTSLSRSRCASASCLGVPRSCLDCSLFPGWLGQPGNLGTAANLRRSALCRHQTCQAHQLAERPLPRLPGGGRPAGPAVLEPQPRLPLPAPWLGGLVPSALQPGLASCSGVLSAGSQEKCQIWALERP